MTSPNTSLVREIDRLKRDITDLRQRVGNLPVRLAAGGSGSSSSQRMVIVQEFGDYITCKTRGPAGDGDQLIPVGKPYGMRQIRGEIYDRAGNLFTSVTPTAVYRVEVIGPLGNEIWQIGPRYIPGMEIEAHRPNGGTGLTTAAPSELDIVWSDLNTLGRSYEFLEFI